jgi:acyl carrier protein
MKSREQIFDLLARILVSDFELPAEQLTPGSELAEDLDLDSIDAIDIAVRLEQETGVRVGEDDLKSIRSLGDVVEIVHSGLASPSD